MGRKSYNNNSNNNSTAIEDNNEKILWSAQKRVCQIDLGNGITNVKLSRGKKLNGLDIPMFEDIVSIAQELKNNDTTSTRVIILSGEGRAFCTGLDLPSMLTKGNQFTNIS